MEEDEKQKNAESAKTTALPSTEGISSFWMPMPGMSGPSNRSPYPTSNAGYPHTSNNAEQSIGISSFWMPMPGMSGPSNRSPYPTSNAGYPHTSNNAEQSIELPFGWEKVEDPFMGVCYIDHVNKITQHEHPAVSQKKISSSAKIPDDKELTSISCKIGINWEILGIQLGVPSHYIDQIKTENTFILMRIYKMLSIWRRMKGSEATMKNLLLNLRKVSDAVSIDWNGLAKIFNPCLKIGSNVNIEYGGTVCVGPFVRLQETGEICFVTARNNFPKHEIFGFKVIYPDSEDQIQAICGEVIAASQELDTALVKISNDFIPKRCTFVDIDRYDLSRAGLKLPYRLTGATDLDKLKPETNKEKRIVVHCPNGRLLTGTLDSEKKITLDTDSPECPVGTSGSAVCLVEDNYSLSCIGILVGMRISQSKNILSIIFQDILEQFSIELGQSLVMETFEDIKETDFLLDPNDAYIFNEALRKGSEKDRFVRINVVGNFRQGQTSLTRRLMNQSLEDIESTDGIDVHVQKCKIKDSEWVSSSTELFENDCLLRFAEESNRMKAPKTSEIINDKYTFEAARYEKGNDTSPDDEIGESFVKSVSDNPLQSPETETSDSISVSIEGCENSSSEAKTDTSFIKKYSSQLKDKMDMPLDNTLSANIWDFGGQFIYNATHQIFHSRDAIYLLVFNLSEDLNESIIDKDFPERKESMRNCLKCWLDSIHAYAGSEEEGLTFANVTKPIVILVGTFKDQFKGNLEEKLYDALDIFVDDLSARRHLLPEQYAVSTTDMSDNEIQNLKEKIYEIGIHHAERTEFH